MTTDVTAGRPAGVTAGTWGLAGKVAIVTGGSRGVGLAVARRLAAGGVYVHAIHQRSPLPEQPGSITFHRGDASDPEAMTALIDEVATLRGRVDVFVHNAANAWRPTAMLNTPQDVLAVDLRLALHPLLCAAKAMTSAAGRLIAVSSSGAHSVIRGYGAHGIAKAALESMVRYLAVELAPRGITVNAVSTSKLDKGPDTPNPGAAAALAAATPAGRLTTPEDVAGVVALLCTAEAGFIQGQVITVDGGLGLWQ
ncbi:SDR family NAD(P)-dependent oxidoreductase [Actinocrispum wychmicini]|uniref:Enoyl-[acyl-carrier protein] reductase III n=1 Tax=Actinocrispum wychmicini TaxID=1213861 RepID=A0A4V2S805_9PSEU|nr:SDR family oxidoreductase [Actinocrispum wychmicini]TCO62050.1 enoyl-[acyl-carrier protein] reductase III [Actinocrispum wychmicini]